MNVPWQLHGSYQLLCPPHANSADALLLTPADLLTGPFLAFLSPSLEVLKNLDYPWMSQRAAYLFLRTNAPAICYDALASPCWCHVIIVHRTSSWCRL